MGNVYVGMAILFANAMLLSACATDDEDRSNREDVASVEQGIGDPPCTAFINGKPNPRWPDCRSGGPTFPPQSCSGIGICYCFCRADHRCDTTPSQCGPLGNCLDGCDDQHPGCTAPPGGFPSDPSACLTGGG